VAVAQDARQVIAHTLFERAVDRDGIRYNGCSGAIGMSEWNDYGMPGRSTSPMRTIGSAQWLNFPRPWLVEICTGYETFSGAVTHDH
jgi:hypothetical protein